MKYMILMLGDQATMMEVKTPEWIREMIAFMGEVNEDLVKAGELVDGRHPPLFARRALRSSRAGRVAGRGEPDPALGHRRGDRADGPG